MKVPRRFSFVLATTILASVVQADVIDFETVPGVGIPSEGLVIDTQYQAAAGVIFSLEGGGAPVIADVGGNQTAFGGPPNSLGVDNPAPDQGIGMYFLTDDGILGGLDAPAVIVSYDPPTAEASGVVLDVDFDETFTIEARDEFDVVLETVTIQAGDPDTGDGIATNWSFIRSSNDVHSIRFKGTRLTPGAFGLGFDLFDARSAPPPVPALPAAGVAALSLALMTLGMCIVCGHITRSEATPESGH